MHIQVRMRAIGVALVLAAVRAQSDEERRANANRDYQLGRSAYERGDLLQAEPFFVKATKWGPEFAEPHFALAQVMRRLGRAQEAKAHMVAAQRIMSSGGDTATPADMPGASAVATAVKPLAKVADEAALRLGAAHVAIGRVIVRIAELLDEGRDLIGVMARSSSPQDAHNAMVHGTQHGEGERLFRMLAASPLEANMWWQLSLNSFNMRREYMVASLAFSVTAALSDAPMVRMSFYLLYHSMQHLCDWREYEARLSTLRERLSESLSQLSETLTVGGGGERDEGNEGGVARGVARTGGGAGAGEVASLVRAIEAPYIFLVSALTDTAPQLLRRAFARQAALVERETDGDGAEGAARAGERRVASQYLRQGRLTVGYLSGLPAGHVTYDLVGSMLRFHSSDHIRPLWYTAATEGTQVAKGSTERGGLKVVGRSEVVELGSLSAAEAAARMRSDGVGLLIDLDGWIGDEPPRALVASSSAPVRAQWLGWAGTTGDPAVNYMVSDRQITPPGHRAHYSEMLLLLPGCYQLNDHAQIYLSVLDDDGRQSTPPPSPTPSPTRRPRLTLANFNQLMKVTPEAFGVWCGGMLRSPDTQLMLLTGVTSARVPYPSAYRNLVAELAMRGVASRRLLAGDALKKSAHLRRAAACQLSVDTLNYNSHTTGSDALWSGLPLLTLPGAYLSSRVGSSLTSTAGLPQTHVASLKAMEDAVALLTAPSDATSAERHLGAPGGLGAPSSRAPHATPPRKAGPRTFGTLSLSWESDAAMLAALGGPRAWSTNNRPPPHTPTHADR